MTEDEANGMAWWNNLSEAQREAWCRVAGSAMPADAWAESKVRAHARGFPLQTAEEAAKGLGYHFEPQRLL
ncbi:MAG: hypothetical protein HQK82_11160 [Desulfovibrionaceae bacterium]|nr:hypothetical protein [Desulfovibrionaceae bacterium]